MIKAAARGVRLGRASVAESRAAPATILDRPRHRLRVPQPDRRRGDRRSRSQPRHRPRLGEAARRARTTAAWSINPEALRRTVECGDAALAQPRAARGGRVRHREGHERGLGTSHPTLTHADVPEKIDVVLVNGDPNPNRPDLPHYGAGETTCKPMLAAVANADLRRDGRAPRRVPFSRASARRAQGGERSGPRRQPTASRA